MDVSSVAAMAIDISQANTANAVQLAVLKKAIDLQGQCALQLLQAATPPASNNPSHLGSSVDTFA